MRVMKSITDAETRRLLGLEPAPKPATRGGRLRADGSRERLYTPERPAELLSYCRTALAAIRDPERVTMSNGRVEFVGEPVRPPSLHGFATAIGCSRVAMTRWQQDHPEFKEAADLARTIIATWWSDAASLRIVDWRWAQFVLRCGEHPDYQEPTQRHEVRAEGGFVLRPLWQPREERVVLDVGGDALAPALEPGEV